MCGICGFIGSSGSSTDELVGIAGQMASAVAHRGPDDADAWADARAGIALAHRRLSIVDLSALGRQPMESPSGRYIVTLNGEFYNYRELRRELEPSTRFRGDSDTEVFLAAVDTWGLNEAVRRATGMFAIALWDRSERKLLLIRDRIGEKPLYYGWNGQTFFFASELKSIRAHPGFRPEIDRAALAQYFRFNYIPAPLSIYQGIRKLVPGTILTIDPTAIGSYPQAIPYWSQRDVALAGARNPILDERAAETELEETLKRAIAREMVADVPIGALLSGGIDSSTIVALMQSQSERPIRTFTIGFHESGFDEAQHAARVARHLRTDHTELYVTPAEAMEVIPNLPRLYDEPYADSSQIPTFLVSRLARRDVTVALSGDGGDELFGGYNRYIAGPGLWRRVSWIPRPLRVAAAHAIDGASVSALNRVGRALSLVAGSRWAHRFDEKAYKAASVLSAADPDHIYRLLVASWNDPSQIVIGAPPSETLLERRREWPELDSFETRMMYLDAMTYLPDDILVKVDRAAMAVSLETRVPMLDHHVVELAARIPLHMKIGPDGGKKILRRILHRYVPRDLVERPKMGFGVPVGKWIRGPLREWAEALLDEGALRATGLINPGPVRASWEAHVSGKSDEQYRLWAVLMFQAWLNDQHQMVARGF